MLRTRLLCRLSLLAVSACAQHIPHGPLGLWVDVSFGPRTQAYHMGSPTGIGIVIRLLQAALWLYGCWVGQMHPVAGVHAPINEPVPIRGRCDDHPLEVCVIRDSLLQKHRQMIGQASLIDHLILLIE